MGYTVFERDKRTGKVKSILQVQTASKARQSCAGRNTSDLPCWMEFTTDEDFKSIRKRR